MSPNFIKVTLKIDGMTCVNCENRIEKKLNNTKGIQSAHVSYSKGTAEISYDSAKIRIDEIIKIIEALDYKVIKSIDKPDKKANINQILGVGIIIFALYMILHHFGALNIFNLFPQAEKGMGYGMLFVIGLLTSLHCVAMCGGINLSQCVPQKDVNNPNNTKLASLRPSFLYNSGRVISYTVIGGIIGGIGSFVSFSGTAKGIVQLVAGVFMVIMGLNMLNVFPWLRKLNPRMPKIFARKINEQKRSNSPLYVGLLNGLMPCGPLQAMQIYALSTGSPLKGAFSMFLFSLGTVPLMFGIGALSSVLTKKFTKKMMTVSAVLVLVLGVFMFNNGMSLSGLRLPSISGTTAKNTQNASANVAKIEDGVQTVTTTLSSGRYEPITVQKGIPVRWNLKAEEGNINGCNGSIIISQYNLQKKLAPGDNIIEFTPDQSGVVPYSCWMGMIRSKITVVDDISSIASAQGGTTSTPDQGALGDVYGGDADEGNIDQRPSCCQ
ncbi:MAG: Heavy metal transport/detoxification protein [Oscillospiraceae bacterium]|jgi:sulfite exporter TauE/SafE/copper chaperone CopZ|nr:Heavy metal transport/detoxification protein [Oscillospiraceae bacterium]